MLNETIDKKKLEDKVQKKEQEMITEISLFKKKLVFGLLIARKNNSNLLLEQGLTVRTYSGSNVRTFGTF